ncbi:fimbrial protein [Klebsiella quasipneumoniae subsp. similipneumoniae]|uniref:fimbrial protein n=1 Tax=Klebsiella quasipneumoniae TaxID=1463165 RepID=UPI00237FFCE3|nr:fimbrial protein [Klebsiella quasipneumoniae]MDE4781792.1 fimbrial protein [Klebsiella quasipneumoniae subsp. similipneumoniae]
MKKIIIAISILFSSLQATASCSYSSSSSGAITVSFGTPAVLADPTLPVGTILSTAVRGNLDPKTFSNCASGDIFVVRTTPTVNQSGVTKINGQAVYETGIPGIGFQISDITKPKGRFIPAVIDQTEPATSRYFSSSDISKQVMVWLVKTGPITQTKLTNYITVYYMAGTPAQTSSGSNNTASLYRIYIDLTNIKFKETTCEISPRDGNTVRLQSIDLSELASLAAGKAAGKPKNFTVDITCPTTEINKNYLYWLNPISLNSSTADGVLLNSLADGATNVGIIIKKGSSAIKFNDLSYTFTTAKNQSQTFSADYYKIANPVTLGVTGDVKVDFEIVLQEK